MRRPSRTATCGAGGPNIDGLWTGDTVASHWNTLKLHRYSEEHEELSQMEIYEYILEIQNWIGYWNYWLKHWQNLLLVTSILTLCSPLDPHLWPPSTQVETKDGWMRMAICIWLAPNWHVLFWVFRCVWSGNPREEQILFILYNFFKLKYTFELEI